MPKKLVCFLIDDDADDQEIFTSALSELGDSLECETANNGMEALEKLHVSKNFIPDFIFLDLNMPRMNGKECLKELKKMNHLDHVPVIIYSTSSAQKDIDETQALGVAYFLSKPASFTELTHALTNIFSGKTPVQRETLSYLT